MLITIFSTQLHSTKTVELPHGSVGWGKCEWHLYYLLVSTLRSPYEIAMQLRSGRVIKFSWQINARDAFPNLLQQNICDVITTIRQLKGEPVWKQEEKQTLSTSPVNNV